MLVLVGSGFDIGTSIDTSVFTIEKSIDTSLGYSHAMVSDGTYLYATAGNKVWKIQISDMTKVAESADYGDTIYDIAYANGYIYIGGRTTEKIWKISTSNMTKDSESAGYGGDINAVVTDSTYVYFGGVTTRTIRKVAQSDITTLVDESSSYGATIECLTHDGTNIFAGGQGDDVCKYTMSDLSSNGSANYGGTVDALDNDGTYVYAGGATTDKVYKIRISDMTKVAESADYGNTIYDITYKDGYVYVTGYDEFLEKLDVSDLSVVGLDVILKGYRATLWDGDYFYIAVDDAIHKITTLYTISE